VDGVLMATVTSRNEKASVTHISFAQWNDGAGTFYVDNVMAGPEIPQAFFSATPTSGTVPLEVAFSDLSTGEISSWSWDFGDSETSDVQNPTHIYTNPGFYTVSLTVTNPGGIDTETKESYVEVLPIEIPNDNTGDDFEVVGDWKNSTMYPGYFGDDYLWIAEGDGSASATWYFTVPYAGTYKVFVWWSASSGRASNAPYTINHAFGSTTVRVDQRINGGQWNELGEFYFEEGICSVVLTNDADDTVIADGVKIEFVSDQIPPSDADFSADVRTGQAPLTVQFADRSTGNITEWLWDFGDEQTSTNQNPTHTYDNPGSYTVTLTVTGPQGTDVEIKEDYIEVSDVEIIVDNLDSGFATIGSWNTSTSIPGYYATNYRYNKEGVGNDKATWSFAIPKAGTYKVYAWWSASSGRASNSPYTINDYYGSTTVRVNQKVDGSQWYELGEFYFKEGNYSVTLTDNADDTVVADAVRIVFLNDQTPPPQADFIVDMRMGLAPLTVHFTDQSVGEIVDWVWDFGDGEYSSEQNPTHVYTMDGVYSVTLTVSSNGSSDSEIKQDFIMVNASDIIVDNLDDNFATLGDWRESTSIPGYYATNYDYNREGVGNDQATWNIRINKAGTYRISAWWSSSSGRTSNAPYTVSHAWGDSTVRVDQRINGGQWNELGEFYFEPSDYSVVLSDDADDTVVADAVKFSYLYMEPPPLQADFSADKRSGEPPLTVQFTDQSSGNITAWEWNFGDNETSTDQNPAHVYSDNGIYAVTLTVHDADGSSTETKEEYIIVSDVEIIVDNSDTDFDTIGSWSSSSSYPGYYANNYQYNKEGTGSDRATWNFNIPKQGTFKVYAWWSAYSSRASNAPYIVNHAWGDSTVRVNQRINGGQWNELGEFYFGPGDKSVVLTDDADDTVVADAVRLLFVSDQAPPPQADFTAAVRLGLSPLTVNFKDQSLGDITGWNWDFGDSQTSTDRNPTITYNNPGTYTVVLTVTGQGETDTETKERYITVSDIEIIIDNLDGDFDTIGTWNTSTSRPGYYSNNYQYNTEGAGNDSATWSFTIPEAGTYKVLAWWSAYSTRASNAPYTINHVLGNTMVRVDQRINGGQWNELGDFYFEPGDYSVILTDDSDDTVIADAIRLMFADEQPPPPIAEFTAEMQAGEAPFAVQFIDQSTGYIADWFWDFGDNETSTEQNPEHIYTNPGIYTVSLTVSDPYGSDTMTKEYFIIVKNGNTESIFAFFGYASTPMWRINTTDALKNIGAVNIKDNLWVYYNADQDKIYMIQIISGLENSYQLFKDALRTDDAHIIWDGHANYGSGYVFATDLETRIQVVEDIQYIDDDRYLNFSSKYFSVPISSMQTVHGFPNWDPIFQDLSYGVMPYTYNDPEFPGDPDNPGIPAFNYYLTYQVPGDPTFYKIRSLRNPAIERFPDSGKPAWYSPDGELPNYQNPDHRKYFITKSYGSGIRSHYSNRTILFRKDMDVPKEEFKYSRMFIRSCYTGQYYLDTFNRGIVFFTNQLAGATTSTARYLTSYLQGKSDEQILSDLQSIQRVFEYYNFNEPPPEREPTFAIQWNVYVDKIFDDGNRDRGALMMLGDNSDGTKGPNSASSERYVFLAFWCPDGGGDNPGDTMSLIAREPGDSYEDSSAWREIASGLSFDTWHTIKVTCDLIDNTYDVYVNGDLVGNDIPAYSPKDIITHISFAQWNDGAGTFYVDDVIPLLPDSTLIVDHSFNASVDSADLIDNGAGRDWYESRNDMPGLLTLDGNNIGGNTTKKARFEGSTSGNAYLTQEFNPPQSR